MDDALDKGQKITEIESELLSLDHRRNQLLNELTQLRLEENQKNSPAQLKLHLQQTSINNQSSQEEKIQLFNSLFIGREDVFSRRYENFKTGKSGHAPVCRNE